MTGNPSSPPCRSGEGLQPQEIIDQYLRAYPPAGVQNSPDLPRKDHNGRIYVSALHFEAWLLQQPGQPGATGLLESAGATPVPFMAVDPKEPEKAPHPLWSLPKPPQPEPEPRPPTRRKRRRRAGRTAGKKWEYT